MALNLGKGKPGLSYDQHLKASPVVSSVSVEKKSGKEPYTSPTNSTVIEHPGVFASKGVLCTVTLEGSRTLNLGNFESARIGVSISIPCDAEAVGEAYTWGTNWVSQRIEEECSGIKAGQ